MRSDLVFSWRKSSLSSSGGDCVELAAAGAVRDSKNPVGPVLRADLPALIAALKANRLTR
ncbi:DUF397 domain-containing protein [Actinophytocola oryzae]|uniref:Uncharacterized protein DUF397 n=1 Tax=Actinophytocola oryzae TaxID=502181 RepID=A0A4V6Q6Y6_9PSEU|nr:DUF397 domain-containing protein [Actinophytocola oryzae]TDV55441.1 uncharacterized protein DUF397 [Actinophytocola oryzae]